MRVLVCGGRDFSDRELISRTLAPYKPTPVNSVCEHKLILGGATGADSLAYEWAEVFGVPFRLFPADWKTHGRAAGPIRNQRMLDEGKPDLVIAFPGGKGTADMVRRARKAGVPVQEIPPAAIRRNG